MLRAFMLLGDYQASDMGVQGRRMTAIRPAWTVSGIMLLRGWRRWREVGAQGFLVGGPGGDAGDVVAADRRHGHAIVDRPDEAGREQHVGAGEAVANEVRPAVTQRVDDVAQLRLEVLAGAFDGDRRLAVDVLQVAVAAHDVEAGRVKLHGDVEAPFQPRRAQPAVARNQPVVVGAVGVGEIGDNGRALGDGEVAVLQHGDLLAWIYTRELSRLGLAGARQD